MQVSVIGIGQTAVGEHWDKCARELAVEAVLAALPDTHVAMAQSLGGMAATAITHILTK